MKKRLYKKALKWFIANRFCLIDPIPIIKGKYKLTVWNQWKAFKPQPIRHWHNVQPLIDNIEKQLSKQTAHERKYNLSR